MKHAIEEVVFVVTIVQVRKSTPVCVATSGRAVFETPPVLGLETMLKMNDGTSSIFFIDVHFDLTQSAETHIFDDKFLRFSVKKAVDQRLSPLGQFLIKVSRFASTPSVQSEVLFHPPCCRKLMQSMHVSCCNITPSSGQACASHHWKRQGQGVQPRCQSPGIH